MKATTLGMFLADWREAEAQLEQGDCLMAEGLALQREAITRMLLTLGEMAAAFPDVPPRSLEALVAPETSGLVFPLAVRLN